MLFLGFSIGFGSAVIVFCTVAGVMANKENRGQCIRIK